MFIIKQSIQLMQRIGFVLIIILTFCQKQESLEELLRSAATYKHGHSREKLSAIESLVQQIIAEGGGFRDFKQYVKKLNMRIRETS